MQILRESKEILEYAQELSNWLRAEKTESITLDCMNYLGIYSTTVMVDNKFRKWAQKLPKLGLGSRQFLKEEVYSIRIYAFKPFQRIIEGAVREDKTKFYVDLTKCLNYDMFRLDVSYRMKEEWLEGLVHYRSSPEPLKDSLRYNLSAQLRDPASLSMGFTEVQVDEFPVTAEVQIQNDINAALPISRTLRRLRILEDVMGRDYDPHHYTELLAAAREKTIVKRAFQKENPSEVLNELLQILRPTRFLVYLSAEPDFRLQRCQWGTQLFETMGSLSLPKVIEVTSRTDLSLVKPAAKGSLLYESRKFSQDLGKLLRRYGK